MTGELATLTTAESLALAELVTTVDRTVASFVECGQALAEIRDRRLYRAEHPTFEAFVLERWGITARRARQLMASASVVASLPSGTAVPLSERQARELMPLRDEPELMAEAVAIAEAFTAGQPTADAIGAAVAYVGERRRLVADLAAGRILGDTVHEWVTAVDPAEWAHTLAVHQAARVLYRTGVELPRPPWWSPGHPNERCAKFAHLSAGPERVADAAWSVLLRRAVAVFVQWCVAVGLGDDPAQALAADVVWNDELLAEWCGMPDFDADDCRLAAVGHVARWLHDDMPPSLFGDEWLPRRQTVPV